MRELLLLGLGLGSLGIIGGSLMMYWIASSGVWNEKIMPQSNIIRHRIIMKISVIIGIIMFIIFIILV